MVEVNYEQMTRERWIAPIRVDDAGTVFLLFRYMFPDWKEAWLFTENTLEEIRNITREIKWLKENGGNATDDYAKELKNGEYSDCLTVAEDVRFYCAPTRTIYRLERMLADFKTGMKITEAELEKFER